MLTQYGNLPIAIDPATGKAKVVRGSTEGRAAEEKGERSRSTERGFANRIKLPGRKGVGNEPVSSPALAPTFDSQLEADRAHYLYGLQLAGDVKVYVHHPFPVPLAKKGLSYTPDFLVWWADGRITVEEVKGSLKQKNARDSRSRLKMAADKFPMFEWQLVMRVRREWRVRRI